MKQFIQKSRLLQETSSNASLTFSAPGGGKYNVITHFSGETDTAAVLKIESPLGTTKWQMNVIGNVPFLFDFDDKNAILGSENAATVISLSAGTNYLINAKGFVHP